MKSEASLSLKGFHRRIWKASEKLLESRPYLALFPKVNGNGILTECRAFFMESSRHPQGEGGAVIIRVIKLPFQVEGV